MTHPFSAAAGGEKHWRITGYLPSHKQFSLSPSITIEEITAALGVEPKKLSKGSSYKVKHQWEFFAERYVMLPGGEYRSVVIPCSIWDYHDARWSAFGAVDAFREVGLLPPAPVLSEAEQREKIIELPFEEAIEAIEKLLPGWDILWRTNNRGDSTSTERYFANIMTPDFEGRVCFVPGIGYLDASAGQRFIGYGGTKRAALAIAFSSVLDMLDSASKEPKQ